MSVAENGKSLVRERNEMPSNEDGLKISSNRASNRVSTGLRLEPSRGLEATSEGGVVSGKLPVWKVQVPPETKFPDRSKRVSPKLAR